MVAATSVAVFPDAKASATKRIKSPTFSHSLPYIQIKPSGKNMMPRTLKIPAQIFLYFCTLFSLSPLTTFAQQVDTAWVRRYNGPGNGDDKAVAISVDSGGNVYVTGSSFDSTTGFDYCTIKYFPNGDTAWARRYNGPANRDDFAASIGLDSSGNIYVTGTSSNSGNSDCATIKYSPNGDTLWVRRFNTQPPNVGISCDSAVALKVDKNGNVYVTGSDWYCGLDLPAGFFLTLKYDSNGNLLWAKTNGQIFYFNNARALVLDKDDNVYVTGKSLTNTNNSDYLTVKYSSGGGQLWEARYDGPTSRDDAARAIAVDSNSNVYVTGGSEGDFASIKYDPNGNQLWVQRFLSQFLKFNTGGGYALSIDSNGNLYVNGQAWDIEAMVWFLVKYSSQGDQLWFRAGGLPVSFNPNPTFPIALDVAGNVCVCGSLGHYATFKYDSQGNRLWNQFYNGPSYPSQPFGVSVGVRDNVYVAGFSGGNGTGNDFATIKYSPFPQLKGDLNRDGMLSLLDIILALNCVFLGEAPPDLPPSACDFNCDGLLTAVDMVILLNMAFLSVSPPC